MYLCAICSCCLLYSICIAGAKVVLLLAQGLFDAAYFNAVFGNVFDQRDELLRTTLLLKPGKHTAAMQPECILCSYMPNMFWYFVIVKVPLLSPFLS